MRDWVKKGEGVKKHESAVVDGRGRVSTAGGPGSRPPRCPWVEPGGHGHNVATW